MTLRLFLVLLPALPVVGATVPAEPPLAQAYGRTLMHHASAAVHDPVDTLPAARWSDRLEDCSQAVRSTIRTVTPVQPSHRDGPVFRLQTGSPTTRKGETRSWYMPVGPRAGPGPGLPVLQCATGSHGAVTVPLAVVASSESES